MIVESTMKTTMLENEKDKRIAMEQEQKRACEMLMGIFLETDELIIG